MGIEGKPDLTRLLEGFLNSSVLPLLFTWFPGRARAFNLERRSAVIDPMVTLEPDMNPLEDIPVLFFGAEFDMQDGEEGVVLCAHSEWSDFKRSGNKSAPIEEGYHEPDYAAFIPVDISIPSFGDLDTGTTLIRVKSTDGKLRLAEYDANQDSLRANEFADSMTRSVLTPPLFTSGFLEALYLWATAMDAAGGPTGGIFLTTLQNAITEMNTGLSGSMLTDKVKVP